MKKTPNKPVLKPFHYSLVHGFQINCSAQKQALQEVETLVEQNAEAYVCFFEANLFSRALLDGEVQRVINQAALVYPDGIAPALCAKLCTGAKFYRVPGPAFLLDACKRGISRNWRHFFLGGAEGDAEKLAKNLQKRFPGLQIAGTYCPPFRALTEAEESEIKRLVEESHADLLWVGLGGPKQEFFMNTHQGKIHVPVMLGVGAAFDFHSGTRPWAPWGIRRFGMEWVWRMISGGRRTFFRNLKCVSHISLVLMKDVLRYWVLRKKKNPILKRMPNVPAGASEK